MKISTRRKVEKNNANIRHIYGKLRTNAGRPNRNCSKKTALQINRYKNKKTDSTERNMFIKRIQKNPSMGEVYQTKNTSHIIGESSTTACNADNHRRIINIEISSKIITNKNGTNWQDEKELEYRYLKHQIISSLTRLQIK